MLIEVNEGTIEYQICHTLYNVHNTFLYCNITKYIILCTLKYYITMLHYKKRVLIYLHAKAVKSDIEAYNRKCFTVRSLLNL